MPASRVVVIGDSLLEVTVAPTEAVRASADARARTSLGPGGQAANVAVRLARRRVAVRLLTSLGADAAGRLLRDAIGAEGVELRTHAAERTGTVVCLIGPGGERTMLSDRVAFESAGLESLLADVRGAAWLHLSGYLLRGAGAPEVAEAVRATAADRSLLSLAGGSVPAGAEAEAFRAAVALLRPDLLVLARDEAAAVTQLSRDAVPTELAEELATFGKLAIVTAGQEGSAVAADGARFAVAAAGDERPLVDTTGAGDAYVAALICGLLNGTWPPAEAPLRDAAEAAARAGAAAARVWGAQGRIDDEL